MQWVRMFEDGGAADRDLLGGKGANLAEMTGLGLPVPPGFTITTDVFRAIRAGGGSEPESLWAEVRQGLQQVETVLDRRFGDSVAPLLVSVRSGAAVSMPGMMDTVLNVGLNDQTVAGLAALAEERFAWDAYRRLVQMYSRVVLGAESAPLEQLIGRAKSMAGVEHDYELSAEQQQKLIQSFRQHLECQGVVMPDDPWEQLRGAVMAVFQSWESPPAMAYREAHDIPAESGTAVTIQAMVFGNMGADSGSGVAFSRNPATGVPGIFGEYMVNAQGEDVVSGARTPQPIAEMVRDPLFAEAGREIQAVSERLETHFAEMQDLEFTVERGTLWMLQARTGKRTAAAAVRIAVDLVDEGLIDRITALTRVEPEQIEQLMHPQITADQEIDVVGAGLAASPGAATGVVVLTADEAIERHRAGHAVILVRTETSAEDFPGMQRSKGILTARGGMTSHAAVVARGMGLPAVTGCSEMVVDEDDRVVRIGEVEIQAGEVITIDGTTGQILRGAVEMSSPGLPEEAVTLLGWADKVRELGVRANADTPEDAVQARTLGAGGIGLCRTEHMFFGNGRLEMMRKLILAESEREREDALERLQVFQTADFAGIFRAMDGFPVTIRLLDPPLHEFLPDAEAEQAELAESLSMSAEEIAERIEGLREVNPMLGLRGVRLGMIHPDITRMQATAIFAAAIVVQGEGIVVEPEIMVPLVSAPAELERQRGLIDGVARALFEKAGTTVSYQVGTMIEVPRAALLAGEIARHADFFSLGTNDLTQMTFGLSRDDAGRFLPQYVDEGVLPADPFGVLDEAGVGQLVEMSVERGRATTADLKVGLCGEHGGEPQSIAFCQRAGLDYVSCSPFRVPVARLAAARAVVG